ncbi:MAG TPA: hypothetical protein VHS99_08775, partial [Chloroflexota bacterium]|nr:hypothetical protein [Chloroflexota bacterium]
GTFGFVLGIIALPGETIVNGEPLPWGEVLLTNLGFTLAALVIIGGAALNLLFGAGAWRLQAWAWWAGVVGNALPALGALLFLAQRQPIPGGAAWACAVLLNLLVLTYLLTPGVRRLFGQVI